MSNNSDEAFEKFKEYDFADAKPVSAVPVLARLQAEKAADRVGTKTCPPYQAIEETLAHWQESLCPKAKVGGLFARSPIAHKWKAPFRSLVLRETVFWRTHDLLAQSFELHLARRTLGARILLRSAFETVATLIYLNQTTAAVVDGTQNFHSFSHKTSRLLLGSRDKSTKHEAINIASVLEKCEKTHPGIADLYAILSESAHPNFEGMCFGYSRIDHDNHVAKFSNNMSSMYEDKIVSAMELCMIVFDHAYNIEWPHQFERLETWLAANDEILEATKGEGV